MVRIPSLESNPTNRHYLGVRAVKANSFDVIRQSEGKTAGHKGLECKGVRTKILSYYRKGPRSLNDETAGLKRTETLRMEVQISETVNSGVIYTN